ncbi:MAG: 4-hydroxy-tetrahydrodipicolinate synthase [Thermoleophilia bacterium]|nr:4-hydroxy-tetrahydrodipicolinate synthase [Thermoleophilia bacterium]
MLGEVLTAIVTPFRDDSGVDLEAFRALCADLVASGSDGLVVAGTTGEASTLTDDEKLSLYGAAVEAVGGRATIIAGTGSNDTAHSVHLTARAHGLGVDAFLVVTPYYNKPPARGIVEHFRAIAAATDRPLVAYNIPQRCVVNIEPETIEQLAGIANVTAVKQATTDPDQARRVVECGLDLYAGNDDLVLPWLELGGVGGICVCSNLPPVGAKVKELIRRFKDGDREGAQTLGRELEPVLEALAVTTNPIPVKAALALCGRPVGGLRLPLVEATEDERLRIRADLERAGVLARAAA